MEFVVFSYIIHIILDKIDKNNWLSPDLKNNNLQNWCTPRGPVPKELRLLFSFSSQNGWKNNCGFSYINSLLAVFLALNYVLFT